VVDGGPAGKAGLRTGDVIVAIDGQLIEDPNSFDYRFATKALGGQAQLGIVRGGKENKLNIALTTAPDTPRDEITIQSRSPFLGAKVSNLSPALADELRLDVSLIGVVIIEVADGSIAQNLGFQKGDVVITVNNTAIGETRDLDRVTKAQARAWQITIQRGGRQMSVTFAG
jgi:S1-C subfamily serine protease